MTHSHTIVNIESHYTLQMLESNLLCNLCNMPIKHLPFFKKYTTRTRYYHIECAQKVNLI